MSVPACVITGNLQNLIGAGTGVVKFTLVNPNVSANPIKVGGTALIDQLSFITSPGASFSITLWGLDVISPSNCYYKTEVFNSGGTLAWVANFNNFVGSGGDFYFRDWHAERRYSTGLLLQKAAHDIDVIHWLCGDPRLDSAQIIAECKVAIGANT